MPSGLWTQLTSCGPLLVTRLVLQRAGICGGRGHEGVHGRVGQVQVVPVGGVDVAWRRVCMAARSRASVVLRMCSVCHLYVVRAAMSEFAGTGGVCWNNGDVRSPSLPWHGCLLTGQLPGTVPSCYERSLTLS
jgi:hypothetical protein